MAAPDGSVTEPEISAVVVWAATGIAPTNGRQSKLLNRERMKPPSGYIQDTPGAAVDYPVSSSSIFFCSGSRRTMRKLRIWPARAGSRFSGAPSAPPFFHLDASMEVRDERSAFPSPLSAAAAPP